MSLSNILHKSGKLEEALLVTNMALEADPKLVASHFTMANIYASIVGYQFIIYKVQSIYLICLILHLTPNWFIAVLPLHTSLRIW